MGGSKTCCVMQFRKNREQLHTKTAKRGTSQYFLCLLLWLHCLEISFKTMAEKCNLLIRSIFCTEYLELFRKQKSKKKKPDKFGLWLGFCRIKAFYYFFECLALVWLWIKESQVSCRLTCNCLLLPIILKNYL